MDRKPVEQRGKKAFRCVHILSAALVFMAFAWCAEAIRAGDAAQEEEKYVRILDPGNENDLREIKRHYPDGVPEGFRVRMETYLFYSTDRGRHIERTGLVVPINEEGERHGVAISRDRRIEYKNDIRHGIEREYSRADGARYLFKKTPWVEGEIHGVLKIFHPDGSIRTVVEYEKGVRVGEDRSYTSEGNLLEVVSYKDGAMHGNRILYFQDSEVKRRIIPYRDGMVCGVVKEFHPCGRVRRRLPYKNDFLHGIQDEYDEEGNLTLRRYWLEGEMVAEGRFRREFEE